MRERGIEEGGEKKADWLEHLQYQSEVKTPDEDMPQFYKVICWWQNQQNRNLRGSMRVHKIRPFHASHLLSM